MKKLALRCIDFYQAHLSPRKGYRCAHGVADGTNIGCSGFAKQAINEHGLIRGLSMLPARFKACKAHGMALRAKQSVLPRSKQAGFIDFFRVFRRL